MSGVIAMFALCAVSVPAAHAVPLSVYSGACRKSVVVLWCRRWEKHRDAGGTCLKRPGVAL